MEVGQHRRTIANDGHKRRDADHSAYLPGRGVDGATGRFAIAPAALDEGRDQRHRKGEYGNRVTELQPHRLPSEMAGASEASDKVIMAAPMKSGRWALT